jgi:hypothetical protein
MDKRVLFCWSWTNPLPDRNVRWSTVLTGVIGVVAFIYACMHTCTLVRATRCDCCPSSETLGPSVRCIPPQHSNTQDPTPTRHCRAFVDLLCRRFYFAVVADLLSSGQRQRRICNPACTMNASALCTLLVTCTGKRGLMDKYMLGITITYIYFKQKNNLVGSLK